MKSGKVFAFGDASKEKLNNSIEIVVCLDPFRIMCGDAKPLHFHQTNALVFATYSLWTLLLTLIRSVSQPLSLILFE